MASTMPARRNLFRVALQPSDERMMTRARAYLAVLGFRHALVGAWALIAPSDFDTAAFRPVLHVMPLEVWAGLFVAIGMQGITIAALGREMHARIVLTISAAVTGAWAAGFVLTAVSGQPISPTMPIIWTALVLKDFIVAGMPLRPPIVELGRWGRRHGRTR